MIVSLPIHKLHTLLLLLLFQHTDELLHVGWHHELLLLGRSRLATRDVERRVVKYPMMGLFAEHYLFRADSHRARVGLGATTWFCRPTSLLKVVAVLHLGEGEAVSKSLGCRIHLPLIKLAFHFSVLDTRS